MSEDYYRFLVRTITTVGQDPAQLRKMIYQFARNELRKELLEKKDFHWAERKQRFAALEKAIEQIESDVADRSVVLSPVPPAGAVTQPIVATQPTNQDIVVRAPDNALVVREDFSPLERMEEHSPLEPVQEYSPLEPIEEFSPLERVIEQIEPDVYDIQTVVGSRFHPIRAAKPINSALWSTVRLVVAVILGVGLFVALENRGDLLALWRHGPDESANAGETAGGRASQSVMQVPGYPVNAPFGASQPFNKEAPIQSGPGLNLQAQNIPTPTAYGVYAVSEGKLTDLQSLPIRVPDERIGISAVFSDPSASTLPNGRLQFVAYRRDLANNAPDRVKVRIVAHVAHELTFDAGGHAKLINVDSSWAVRSNSYEMQVAPVSGNPEMVVIRPVNPTFLFPAGRYALVLQGSAYDFSVAGPITDLAQCLEQTDALNMPVYTECSHP
jgi:hypothetical protein